MDLFKKNIQLIALLVVAFCITTFFSYGLYSSVNSFDKFSKIFAKNTISNITERCNAWLSYNIKLANGLVGYIDIQKSSDIFEYQKYFYNAVEAYKFMDVTVGFEDGTVAAGMPEGLPEGYDPRTRDWYINAIKANAPYISEPYIDITTGFPCITVCTPVQIENKTVGIFSFDLDLSGLDNILLSARNAITGGTPVLITSDGTIITHERKDYTLKNISEISPNYADIVKFITDPANKGKPILIISGLTNKTILFTKLNYNNWYILYEMPSIATNGTIVSNKIISIILTLLATAALSAVFVLFRRKTFKNKI